VASKAVLIVSGALGFFIVARYFPDWQVAVESAQVVAGIVDYPRDNSFFIYHVKLWTVLHQICAVLLRLGFSEATLSRLLTGVQGMLTFQALAMFVYAINRSAILALTSLVIIIASGTANVGATYPIFLLGTAHTYGAMGLSLLVLAAALIGCGEHRLGLFLTGLAPAIHPSLGIWLALALAVCLACDVTHARRVVREGWTAFAAGCAISAASLGVHLLMARGIPPVPAEVSARYVSAFTALWDEHRQPVRVSQMGVLINIAALAVALVWSIVRRDLFVVRFAAVTAAASLGFVYASWIPPDRLPSWLVMLMPTRLLNVNAMTFTALVIGLLGTLPWKRARWAMVALAGLIAIGRRSMLWDWLRWRGWIDSHVPIDPAAALVIAAAALVAAAWFVWRDPAAAPRRSVLAHVAMIAIAGGLMWAAAGPVRAADPAATVFRDRRNDVVFQAAARGRGLLLTGGDLYLIQLRTRRPLLLNAGALDSLPYAPESAPVMDRVLRDVYGIDLFHPPPGAEHHAVVPPEYNRELWQRFPLERWQQIKRDYNVTQVMVPANWILSLPLAAQNRQFLLYDIP
jgi:hypothetical protein